MCHWNRDGAADVGLIMGEKAEIVLFNWIPVDKWLYVARQILVHSKWSSRNLFAVSANAPTDLDPDTYQKLHGFLHTTIRVVIMVLIWYLNARISRLSWNEETHSWDHFYPNSCRSRSRELRVQTIRCFSLGQTSNPPVCGT